MAYEKAFTELTVMDSFQRTKRKRVEMVSVDPVQMDLDANTILTAYQNATDGGIIRIDVRGSSDVAAVVPAGTNIDSGVTVSCRLFGSTEKASLKWPAPALAMFNADGTLNLADAAVLAVQALYESGGVALLSDGQSIESFLSGSLDK